MNLFFTIFICLCLTSCSNNDITFNDISNKELSRGLSTIQTAKDFYKYWENLETSQERQVVIKYLEDNKLSHILETIDKKNEGEFINLRSGIVVKKIGDKYCLSDDIILTEKQLNILSETYNSNYWKNIKLERSDTKEILLAKFAKEYPHVVFPSYNEIKNYVKGYRKHLQSRGAAQVGLVMFDLWDEEEIPYTFSSNFPETKKNKVLDAIAYWNSFYQTTKYKFVTRSNQSDFIEFTLGEGNSSYVGRIGGKQEITLDQHYFSFGNVVHEIGHAIGLLHEQCKENRDNFVVIHSGNIENGKQHNFVRQNVNCAQFDEFDWGSIMLYDSYAFTNNGLPTMTKKSDGSTWEVQRDTLSQDDINIIPKMVEMSIIATYIYLMGGGN